jgi:hypothetical protein
MKNEELKRKNRKGRKAFPLRSLRILCILCVKNFGISPIASLHWGLLALKTSGLFSLPAGKDVDGGRQVWIVRLAGGINGRDNCLSFATQRECGLTKINKWKILPANTP